jgi:hypothetical protein
VDSAQTEREGIRRLVRELGEARGSRPATPAEVARLRDLFGRRVLRSYVDGYIQSKYDQHVEIDGHWPRDTAPDEYLEALRDVVLDPASAIYLTDFGEGKDWSIYFVGRVRRRWRGPNAANRIVVIFNGEHHRFVSGFQPEGDDAYAGRQGGFWLFA